jgi:hypothetical protein
LADRDFTLEEAEEVLVELRPLAERMVEARRELVRAAQRLEAVGRAVAGNGGGLSADEASRLHERADELASEIAACVQAITDAGGQVKGLDEGLLDFPTLREGERVLLCWRVGEDRIRFWHGYEEGFAGRKPLDS